MTLSRNRSCIAFAGSNRIARGSLMEVATAAKKALDRDPAASVQLFDESTAEVIEVDFRGTARDVAKRLASDAMPAPEESEPRGPGRPRLGVVAREVTLLPRHWDWLNSQPGGASVALRKLVEEARKTNAAKDRTRRAQEIAYRFMHAMAGNESGFSEAARALFASDAERFAQFTATWPPDVREHARQLAAHAFA